MAAQTSQSNILLTGATGFIGRCVLRELLLRGRSVVVIVRPRSSKTGVSRLRGMMRQSGWPGDWDRSVHVVEGSLPDVIPPKRDLIHSCDRIIHCAAALNFDQNRGGEPQRTNVDGTIQLGQLANECGIQKFLYVSTAYVCGHTRGLVSESVFETGKPRNDYEASKRQAEKWLVEESGLDWTIARPGIVVGDSRTGHTGNYLGVYRVLKSIARLCERLPVGSDGMKSLPMRLRFTGKETSHLIPVDFVSSAITDLALRDDVSHECVHLTPDTPVTTATLLEAISTFHRVQGIEFVGAEAAADTERNVYERIFDRETQIVGQYFGNDPEFDTTNRKRLLPDFSNQPVDAELLLRLEAFGAADHWGNAHGASISKVPFDCADFFSRHFPAASADSNLPKIPGLSTVVRFEITGAENHIWICRLEDGRVVDIAPTSTPVSGNIMCADFL